MFRKGITYPICDTPALFALYYSPLPTLFSELGNGIDVLAQ